MKLLWFPVAVKSYCHLGGARHYKHVELHLLLFVEKEITYANIVYAINFFNYQKAVGYTKLGGGSLGFFFQKGYVIFGSNKTWESLFRATVRAHLYKGKCVF